MNDIRSLFVVLAGACVLVTGCDDAETSLGENAFNVPRLALTGGIPDPPPTGGNGDDSGPLWSDATLDALEKIGSESINQGNGMMRSFPALPADSRQYLRSAVACALRENQSVLDADTGETYSGRWALAPGWMSGALTVSDRRWVSACMLQKLNAFEAPVPILLEGGFSVIQPNPTYTGVYDFIEGTVFGDLFCGRENAEAFVCYEDSLVAACGDPAAALQTRICYQSASACNLTQLGPCNFVGTQYPLNGSAYWEFPTYGYTEAIRVRLKTEDASCYGH